MSFVAELRMRRRRALIARPLQVLKPVSLGVLPVRARHQIVMETLGREAVHRMVSGPGRVLVWLLWRLGCSSQGCCKYNYRVYDMKDVLLGRLSSTHDL